MIRNLLLLLALISLPLPAAAKEAVLGRYLSKGGQEIKIELEVSAPAPALVIIIQNLPSGVAVTGSSPEAKLAEPGQGLVKWLLSGLAPGKQLLQLKLDKAVEARALSGEIRYRDPATGNMVSWKIAD